MATKIYRLKITPEGFATVSTSLGTHGELLAQFQVYDEAENPTYKDVYRLRSAVNASSVEEAFRLYDEYDGNNN